MINPNSALTRHMLCGETKKLRDIVDPEKLFPSLVIQINTKDFQIYITLNLEPENTPWNDKYREQYRKINHCIKRNKYILEKCRVFKLGHSDLGFSVPLGSYSCPGICFLYLSHVEKHRQKKEKAIILF